MAMLVDVDDELVDAGPRCHQVFGFDVNPRPLAMRVPRQVSALSLKLVPTTSSTLVAYTHTADAA